MDCMSHKLVNFWCIMPVPASLVQSKAGKQADLSVSLLLNFINSKQS